MAAEDQQRREAAGRCKRRAAIASRWLLGALAALGASALLYFLTGLTGWIAVACAIASAASLAAYFGRQDAAARWITEYARAQDCNALTGEFTAVLDVVARGALGGRARERLLDACRGWRDQIGQSGEWEAKQVASWTGFIRGQRRPLTDTFDPLGTVSRDWVAKLGRLEAATAFGHTEQWLKGQQPCDSALFSRGLRSNGQSPISASR